MALGATVFLFADDEKMASISNTAPIVVSDQEWIAARIALLEEEKALSKATMALARKRAALPCRVVQDYVLE